MTVGLIILSKVVVATVLAVPAEILRRRSARVEPAYALWVTVLAVLLLPAVVAVPVPVSVSGWLSAELDVMADWSAHLLGTEAARIPDGSQTAGTALTSASSDAAMLSAVVVLWLMGAVVVVLRQTGGLRAVDRLVRFAGAAPATVCDRCAAISAELGVAGCPEVVTARGVFSPFLWHPIIGRIRVVIPDELLDRLTDQSLDSVLRHELIHLRRRDAWRRRVEILILALWWWLPTAWIARRRLRELEELCVDAAVLRANPAGAKAYALALLETEEFLSRRRPHRVLVVPALTAAGGSLKSRAGNSLKSRITRVAIHTHEANRPSRRMNAAVQGLVVAALSLGLLTASVTPRSIVEPDVEQTAASWQASRREPRRAVAPSRDHSKIVEHHLAGLPNSESVTVTESDREIVLTWNGDNSSGEPLNGNAARGTGSVQTVRLIRISEDGVEPRLWRIHEQHTDRSEGERVVSPDLRWIFGFLNVNNEIIDHDGTRHCHPALFQLS